MTQSHRGTARSPSIERFLLQLLSASHPTAFPVCPSMSAPLSELIGVRFRCLHQSVKRSTRRRPRRRHSRRALGACCQENNGS
jgi:hypothetical protein